MPDTLGIYHPLTANRDWSIVKPLTVKSGQLKILEKSQSNSQYNKQEFGGVKPPWLKEPSRYGVILSQ